ncbi:MAG: A/G-specific adenine glycosylase [Gammaproteobacteria bacterium]|nr:MAG: A/G-specific adenine glycosylase [Gammaproteobacteria bacterium]
MADRRRHADRPPAGRPRGPRSLPRAGERGGRREPAGHHRGDHRAVQRARPRRRDPHRRGAGRRREDPRAADRGRAVRRSRGRPEPADPRQLARRLLPWFDRHGRHDLPWQREPTPYRVWVSEVMLQQTRVETVIPYFERFLRRFPDVAALAAASEDEVLHLWSGLGYYSRARHLHAAARRIVAAHGGELPADFAGLTALPGIGRSTAGAIAALARGERRPILDGNVKRVLARYFLVRGWPGDSATAAQLWQLAEACTPARRTGAYTQAIMDLGATVCTRARPACERCPLEAGCAARAAGLAATLPERRPVARPRPERRRLMLLVVRNGAEILLERRPGSGIWGGLWTPPEFAEEAGLQAWCRAQFGPRARPARLPGLRHSFTHFDLEIEPWQLRAGRAAARVEEGGRVWYNSRAPSSIGLPAPVSRLIEGCLHGVEGSGQESSDGKDDPVRGARSRGRGARAGAVAR